MRSAPEAVKRTGSSGFGDGADRADGERSAEDAQVVVVDLVAETGVADLVESLKTVEARRVAVRHDQAMKGDGEPRLAEGFDLAGFAEELGSRRNQKMLTVVGIDVVGEKTLDGPGELPVETIDENGFEYGSFKQNVGLFLSPWPVRQPDGDRIS